MTHKHHIIHVSIFCQLGNEIRKWFVCNKIKGKGFRLLDGTRGDTWLLLAYHLCTCARHVCFVYSLPLSTTSYWKFWFRMIALRSLFRYASPLFDSQETVGKKEERKQSFPINWAWHNSLSKWDAHFICRNYNKNYIIINLVIEFNSC